MENVFLAATNLYGVRALYVAEEWIHFNSVLLCILASMTYHLIEYRKHGMPGIGYATSTSAHEFFLNLDRIVAIWTFFIFVDYSMISDHHIRRYVYFGALMQYLSERVYRWKEDKTKYIICHALWHLAAYHVLYLQLVNN